MQLLHDCGSWRPVLTTGQHAGRLLGGSGKAPQDAKFMTQEASVSHGTDWPYLALSVPWDNLHTWASVSGDRLAYGTYEVRSLPWRVALIAFQDRGPWKLGLTTGQHAGRLLAGFGKGRRRRPYESRCTVCSAPAKSVG